MSKYGFDYFDRGDSVVCNCAPMEGTNLCANTANLYDAIEAKTFGLPDLRGDLDKLRGEIESLSKGGIGWNVSLRSRLKTLTGEWK